MVDIYADKGDNQFSAIQEHYYGEVLASNTKKIVKIILVHTACLLLFFIYLIFNFQIVAWIQLS